MNKVELKLYENAHKETMLEDIAAFWSTHYQTVTPAQAAGNNRRMDIRGARTVRYLFQWFGGGFPSYGKSGRCL